MARSKRTNANNEALELVPLQMMCWHLMIPSLYHFVETRPAACALQRQQCITIVRRPDESEKISWATGEGSLYRGSSECIEGYDRLDMRIQSFAKSSVASAAMPCSAEAL
jgi:hypothetical protein